MSQLNTPQITVIACILLFAGCGRDDPAQIYWVGGYTVACTGVGEQQCLLVSKNEDKSKAEWENFYAPIEGFEFKEGVAQQIRVQTEELEADQVPQDASSIRYVQTEVLSQQPDLRYQLNASWTVNDINETTIQADSNAPIISIDLETRSLSGNDTCQDFTVPIERVDFYNFSIAELPNNDQSCSSYELASSFHQALLNTLSYRIEEQRLFLNGPQEELLIGLTKGASLVVNPQLAGNWFLTRINNGEITRSEHSPVVAFDLDTKNISGSDGCNKFTGSFTLGPNRHIELGPLATTRRACISDEVNSLARDFHQAMERITFYQVNVDELVLFDSQQNPLLQFKKGD